RGKPPGQKWAAILTLEVSPTADPKTQEHMETTTTHAGEATALTMQYADALVRAAASSPDAVHTLADAWGIPPSELKPVLAGGDIPKEVWDRLAARALDEVG